MNASARYAVVRGMGDYDAMMGEWTGTVAHSDPSVCRANLARKRWAQERATQEAKPLGGDLL